MDGEPAINCGSNFGRVKERAPANFPIGNPPPGLPFSEASKARTAVFMEGFFNAAGGVCESVWVFHSPSVGGEM